MKYRKKPVVVEAIQYTGNNDIEIMQFVGKDLIYDIIDTAWKVGKGAPHIINVKIHTLEGDMECSRGAYIIKGVNGEFYPCKPDVFEKTYEAVIDDRSYADASGLNYADNPTMKTEEDYHKEQIDKKIFKNRMLEYGA